MGLFRRGPEKPGNIPVVDSPADNSFPLQDLPVERSGSTMSPQPAAPRAAQAGQSNEDTEAELDRLREIVLDMQRTLNEVAESRSETEKVFDVLHTELQQYKNDFIYEHLKPVLWPLLFLFDSLEQYAREIVGRVSYTGDATIEAKEVMDHLKFFRGQLVEALRICEVTPMKQPSGLIDPKSHKGIGIEKVDKPEDENTIRRVVRTGWYLNGKVLRHAEVIVGKFGDDDAAAPASPAAPTAKATGAPAKSAIGNLSRAAETLRTSSDASASGGGRGG
jgi:molecular chaperone GrpE (heat shock protein)